MADISTYLAQIMAAVYGEDVRSSIHDAIDIINQVSEVVLTTGTAVTSASSSSTGFFEDSLYLNTNTWDLWKCVGTDTWNLEGNVEGNSITSIVKTSSAGLADTYTIHYSKEPDSTFVVTNGKDGNQWYRGIQISGKNPTAQVYPTGIANANPNDSYLNPTEGAVYYCVTGGNASTATWAYEFTMTGGGGASALIDLTDVNITGTPDPGQLLTYDSGSGKWINADPDTSFVKYGGALNFADLATYASTYLDSAYEDTFFLLRTGGAIGTGDASAYWSSNFSDGDYIPADSHIAVININRGTMNPAVYKYDDFGGFVDISGKADKTELDEYTTASYANASYQVEFDNLNPAYGYSLWVDDIILNWTSMVQAAGTGAGTIKQTYTVASSGINPINGASKSVTTGSGGTVFKLRIFK